MSDAFEKSPWDDPIANGDVMENPAAVWGASESPELEPEPEYAASPPPPMDIATPDHDSVKPVSSDFLAEESPYSEEMPSIDPLNEIPSSEPVASDAPTVAPVYKPKQRKTRNSGLEIEEVEVDPLHSATANLADVDLEPPVAQLSLNPKPDEQRLNPTASSGSTFNSKQAELRQYSKPKTEPVGPHFRVEVSVSDANSAHTSYTVDLETDSPEYETQKSQVQRRYKQFRTLYKLMVYHNPGFIIPPPPDKQVLGRFEENFIQQRRLGLERMLSKIVKHPVLQKSPPIVHFLTDEDFELYVEELMKNQHIKGVLQNKVNDATISLAEPTSVFGFLGDTFSKRPNRDQLSLDYQKRADALESDMQRLLKCLGQVREQRGYVKESLTEFAGVIKVLAEVEPTKNLVKVLKQFAQCHEKLAEIYDRLNFQDMLNLEATLDEQVRIVNSIKTAIVDRDVALSVSVEAEQALEKAQRKKASTEEIDDKMKQASKKAHSSAAVSKRLEREMKRIDEERLREISEALELYTENAIEAKKEAIEMWETFYANNFPDDEQSE